MMKNTLKKFVVFLLEKEARAVLKKYKPKIVAITGTVGKTSTKDAIFTALSRFYFCHKSQKSFNSEIGIPLTILDAPNAGQNILGWIKTLIEGAALILLPTHYPEWLVLEVGADAPGDIESVAKWIHPDIVVVTQLSKVPVHVEAFASPEDLFKEKGNLVKALKPGGTLVLNADDEDVLAYRNLSEEKVVLFGRGSGADITSGKYEIVYDSPKGENQVKIPKGVTFEVTVLGENGRSDEVFPVYLGGTIGEHHAYHVLAAFAVCKILGEHLSVVAKSFKHHEPTPGRMRIIEGIKNTTILDDTYNSSPIAVGEALKSLRDLEAKRKIAALGDMLELGKFSIDEHKKVGGNAASVCSVLICVGVRARYMAEGALIAGMKEEDVYQFDDSKEAGAFLQNFIEEGDAILVKGSQGIRMEKVVEEIMAEPEEKEYLLVRQDKEWRNK